ncbi:MAG: type VI secretion system lipoprotein TssJ [Arcobacter sp.]|uniref:type VI secretion system lipoprotein TssJ n=1 Tax=Arcobacter sp. TaxID=1872629 RepID=UPI003C70B251
MNIKFSIFILISFIVLITGCASKPTHLELVIKSAKDLNPDIDTVSSPLMLTFYELESAEKFLKYDFWRIIDDSGKNLEPELISQSKQIITPLQEQTYNIVFDNRAKFLGIIAKFRNIDGNNWRQVINLEKDSYNFSEFEIKKFNIKRVE